MAVKEIITDKDILVKSKVFNVPNNQDTVISITQDLFNTLDANDNYLFLASNQVGHEERAIAIKFRDSNQIFFNPVLQKRDKMFFNRERDPYTKNEYFVPRFAELTLVSQDGLGANKAFKPNEAASVVVCQAMDALDGIFPDDYGTQVPEGFDDFTEDEKAEVLEEVAYFLVKKGETLDEELSKDEDTAEVWSAAKFIQSSANGEIDFEKDPPSKGEQKRLKKFIKSVKATYNRNKFWRKQAKKNKKEEVIDSEGKSNEVE